MQLNLIADISAYLNEMNILPGKWENVLSFISSQLIKDDAEVPYVNLLNYRFCSHKNVNLLCRYQSSSSLYQQTDKRCLIYDNFIDYNL